jgi:hypothetical protein
MHSWSDTKEWGCAIEREQRTKNKWLMLNRCMLLHSEPDILMPYIPDPGVVIKF